MPELPEVEIIRRKLERYIVAHRIEKVEVKYKKIFDGNEKKLFGKQIICVRRFGKALVIDTKSSLSLIIHVKMTGQFIYRGPNLKNPPKLSKKVGEKLPNKHTHVIFHLDKGGILYYNDVRKFSWMKLLDTSEVRTFPFIKDLGPEPLEDLTFEKFSEILSGGRTAIKTILMDQKKIAGVGNIYANDALWLSRIHPKTTASKLTEKKKKDLFEALVKVLKDGIKEGGSSQNSYVTPDGGEGNYQKHFLVYGQDGKLCTRCKKEKVTKIKINGRGTFLCTRCQGLNLREEE